MKALFILLVLTSFITIWAQPTIDACRDLKNIFQVEKFREWAFVTNTPDQPLIVLDKDSVLDASCENFKIGDIKVQVLLPDSLLARKYVLDYYPLTTKEPYKSWLDLVVVYLEKDNKLIIAFFSARGNSEISFTITEEEGKRQYTLAGMGSF